MKPVCVLQCAHKSLHSFVFVCCFILAVTVRGTSQFLSQKQNKKRQSNACCFCFTPPPRWFFFFSFSFSSLVCFPFHLNVCLHHCCCLGRFQSHCSAVFRAKCLCQSKNNLLGLSPNLIVGHTPFEKACCLHVSTFVNRCDAG